MDLRFKVASVLTRAGVSIGTQPDERSVRSLLEALHPVTTPLPLVRVGGASDGGYLLPDDLDGIAACFSPGVAQTASFEEAMLGRGIPCFLADASVDGAPLSDPRITFEKKFLGVVNDDVHMTLDDWVARNAPLEGDLLLQMDIEGAEWPVLLATSPQVLDRFRIIVLEMHDLDRILDKFGFVTINAVFRKLLSNFLLIHNHPNNCDAVISKGDIEIPRVLELTFLRKDRAATTGWAKHFPHPLDATNQPRLPDIRLPRVWYRQA